MMGKRGHRRQIESRSGRFKRRPVCEFMERRLVLSSCTVTSTGDTPVPGTLLWAIMQINGPKDPGGTISFDIPDISGSSVQTIDLSMALPAITAPVVIDGTSQPNYAGSPLIQIDGSGIMGTDNDGLVLSGGSSTVEGLSIVGFTGSGIVLSASGDGSQITASYVGYSRLGQIRLTATARASRSSGRRTTRSADRLPALAM